MEHNSQILQELNEVSPILIGLNSNVFALPNGYFNALPENLLANISVEENVLLPIISNPQTVPANYFDNLSTDIFAKIKLRENTNNECFEELQNIAPVLNNINKSSVYKLPNGYFDQLTLNISKNTTTKVVKFGKIHNWAKYAVAAIMVGVLITAAITFYKSGTAKSQDIQTALTKTTDAEIQQYLEQQTVIGYSTNSENISTIDDELILEGTSDEEIQQYLNEQINLFDKPHKDI